MESLERTQILVTMQLPRRIHLITAAFGIGLILVCILVVGSWNQQSTLHRAIASGDNIRVAELLEAGWSPTAAAPLSPDKKDRRKTPVAIAVQCHRPVALQLLRDAGASLDYPLEDTKHPYLYWAIYERDEVAVRILLQAGASANAAGPHGKTPLMYASESGLFNAAMYLLEYGADPRSITEDGVSAMTYLCHGFRDRDELSNMIEVVIASWPGALNWKLSEERSRTVAMYLVEQGVPRAYELIQHYQCDQTIQDADGFDLQDYLMTDLNAEIQPVPGG